MNRDEIQPGLRRTCSCGTAWADEPGHDDNLEGAPLDPNETLRRMREAYATEDYETAAELADRLDQWISAGGYLPVAWNASHPPF